MHFLADVYVTCEECGGKRFHKDVLSVRYRNRNIDDILAQTVNEAINFFYEAPSLGRKLKVLQDVDIHVMPGEALGIVGPNGAGKTTLFGAFAGSFPLTSGRIVFAG